MLLSDLSSDWFW